MEFIPILEEDGTIRQVGEWLLNEALSQAALWRMENSDFVISVNVSYIQILQEGFQGNGDTDRGRIRHTGEAADPGAYREL